jgi:hypothetical protein
MLIRYFLSTISGFTVNIIQGIDGKSEGDFVVLRPFFAKAPKGRQDQYKLWASLTPYPLSKP